VSIKQIRVPSWVGAYQVQVMNSAFYTGLASTVMLLFTFWYTAGYQIRDRYLPFVNLWEFAALGVILLWGIIPYLDYTLLLKSRVEFANKQACKHENPAMDELAAIRKELAEIKRMIK
jgi:hypothetical protein